MIKFTKIENGEIFTRDFKPLVKNNEITFAIGEEIAVIYGPNGTGKTSLIKILSDDKGTKLEYEYASQMHTTGLDIFHIINDQNSRNIIVGETKDFFLGDNIKREFELQALIAVGRKNLIDAIITTLKARGISAISSHLIDLIHDADISNIIRGVVNSKSKGDKLTTEYLISTLSTITKRDVPEYDEKKLLYLQSDFGAKDDSIIAKLEALKGKPLTSNAQVHQIEENTEAINILTRFQKDECIVCDTLGIDWKALLLSKTNNRTEVIGALSDDIKPLVEKIINLVPSSDPFQIKKHLISAISNGADADIVALLEEVSAYKLLYSLLVLNDLEMLFKATELSTLAAEYEALIDEKPEITQEVLENRESIKANLKMMLDDVLSPEKQEAKIRKAKIKIKALEAEIKVCVSENARKPLNQHEYQKRYVPLAEEYDKWYKELASLETELESLLRRREIIGKYLSTIEEAAIADKAFDMRLWGVMVEKVIVKVDGKLEFVLHDGSRFMKRTAKKCGYN